MCKLLKDATLHVELSWIDSISSSNESSGDSETGGSSVHSGGSGSCSGSGTGRSNGFRVLLSAPLVEKVLGRTGLDWGNAMKQIGDRQKKAEFYKETVKQFSSIVGDFVVSARMAPGEDQSVDVRLDFKVETQRLYEG